MDFHTLSRRDLQALCKKNKIPANMTNVAMAEALQSLQTVEGLEEVLAHPATDSLQTPAKSLAASNRQRTVKKEPDTSKMTRTQRGTRKAGEETAQSTLKKAESSTVQQAYSTRRSTRLLEKQMGQLSLKENEAILEQDSQDMQRQFSADMENSLALNNETSDETKFSKEATEEPHIVEVPLKYTDSVLENESPTIENSKQHEIFDAKVEDPNLVDVPVRSMDKKSLQFEPYIKLENDDADLENSSDQKECKDDEVQPMQEDAVDPDVTHYNMNAAGAAQSALSAPMIENENTSTEFPMQQGVYQLGVDNAQNAVAALSTITVDEHVFESEDTGTEEIGSSNIPCHNMTKVDDVDQISEIELSEDEFDFLSDSESSNSQSEEEVDQKSEPALDGENSFGSIKFSESTAAEEVNEVSSCKNSENQEKFPLGGLQDENISVVGTATPVEKKSLRQLKKMVKEKKQALQVHQENV